MSRVFVSPLATPFHSLVSIFPIPSRYISIFRAPPPRYFSPSLSFDLIVANPPYLLDASERAYRHGGGMLGAGLSLAIVDAALERLEAGGSLLLYTGVAMVEGGDPFLARIRERLASREWEWDYQELDPDVFAEELDSPAYRDAERIAVVGLRVTRPA